MLLNDLIEQLKKSGYGIHGTWEMRGRKGIVLGDPEKYFPHPVGPQYTVDTTDGDNPNLTPEEVNAIKRRFGLKED